MYQRILVPIDGSTTATRGLDEAVALARLTHARLRLLCVLDVLTFASGFEPAATYVADVVPLMKQAGVELLAAAKLRAAAAGVEADSVLVERVGARIAEIVAEQALEWKADLVVVGTHGRRGIGRALLGSDAEQILRCAPVPVLLVRSAPAPA
ncbi:MAG: universal stress protein [Proteobacteria bacterium]|nr:universal stress protein [Pseudomonadota bacterium]